MAVKTHLNNKFSSHSFCKTRRRRSKEICHGNGLTCFVNFRVVAVHWESPGGAGAGSASQNVLNSASLIWNISCGWCLVMEVWKALKLELMMDFLPECISLQTMKLLILGPPSCESTLGELPYHHRIRGSQIFWISAAHRALSDRCAVSALPLWELPTPCRTWFFLEALRLRDAGAWAWDQDSLGYGCHFVSWEGVQDKP